MKIVFHMLVWAVVMTGTGAVLNSRGPFSGWADGWLLPGARANLTSADGATPPSEYETIWEMNSDSLDRDASAALPPGQCAASDNAAETAARADEAPEAPAPVAESSDGDPLPPIPDELVAKTELEKMYEALGDIHLKRLRKPRIGRTYTFDFSNGESEEGRLESRSEGAISIRLEHGVMQIPIQGIDARERARFFPEQAARILALRDLGRTARELELVRVREEIRRGRELASKGAADESDGATEAGHGEESRGMSGARRSGPFRADTGSTVDFDAAPAESPDDIKPLLGAFARWLEVQQRRVGGPVAESVHAKRHANGSVALYLEVADAFCRQEYETRFRLTDSIWQFWSFRCHEAGVVPHPRRAFLVLVDADHRIVGGSRPDQSNDVWVEKTGTGG